MGCGDEKLSKYLTQTFMAHCSAMICQQVTLSGDAEWPKVADAVIEAEQGTGPPVIFVHGAWMDLRYWEPQRQAIAMQYRFIAYTQRYHGTAPWPDAGPQYSAVTHA